MPETENTPLKIVSKSVKAVAYPYDIICRHNGMIQLGGSIVTKCLRGPATFLQRIWMCNSTGVLQV
jgi:hypothetical protein